MLSYAYILAHTSFRLLRDFVFFFLFSYNPYSIEGDGDADVYICVGHATSNFRETSRKPDSRGRTTLTWQSRVSATSVHGVFLSK
jgi:hypothetical protein